MPNSFVTLFDEYGLPAPNGLAIEFESNSLAERLPRYSAWTLTGMRRRTLASRRFRRHLLVRAFSLGLDWI
jgi:hypothetical protein